MTAMMIMLRIMTTMTTMAINDNEDGELVIMITTTMIMTMIIITTKTTTTNLALCISVQEIETPTSEQYETADHYDSGTDRSSALSRFSDSTAISSFAGDGETFDVTDADITVVSSLAS